MDSFIELYQRANEHILKADNIAIITHINPDGDCIGSAAALQELIHRRGKNARIFNENGCPEYLRFLDCSNDIHTDGDRKIIYDLVIWVDCGSLDRAGKVSWVTENAGFMINIDHHATNTMYADINIVDETAAATGVMIYDMYKACGEKITKYVAELLYMAIATDTGNFSYTNADKRAHNAVGDLIEAGVDVADLSLKLFRLTTYNRLKLMALSLDTINMYCDGKIAVMKVTKAMFAETGTDSSDCETFISFARDIKGVEIAALLRDTTDGKLVKVSLRSTGNVDVSKIAESFGGGGHFSAAGCSIEGKIPEIEKILAEKLSKEIL